MTGKNFRHWMNPQDPISEPPSTNLGFRYTRRDFHRLRRLVYEYAGINLSESKQELVFNRLFRRLRVLGIRDFEDYCALLEAGNLEEFRACINAITTNHTFFFREPHHFEFLAQLLPRLAQERSEIRIWSAGCSAGQEPYSIAMVAKEVLPPEIRWRLLATDVNTEVLDQARQGVYAWEEVKDLPGPRLKRWFLRGRGRWQGWVRVTEELRQAVCFQVLNLMEPWPVKHPFDVIFCRNVSIYFDPGTKRRLFARLADTLVDGGYLFVGHSENLVGLTDRFRPVGRTIYRKRS